MAPAGDAMSLEEEAVRREAQVHGARWEGLHHRYFSDSKVAEPLTAAILEAVDASRPDVVADLGGGTGFILKELLRERLAASAASVTRRDLGAEGQCLLLVARSLLHYFGRAGLQPLLRHLRGQLQVGEAFVHQSACFADEGDAACLNRVYGMMGTEKRYFTIDELEAALEEAGFALREIGPAPPLRLDSVDLAERYGLRGEEVASIREEVGREFGERAGVFVETRSFRDAVKYLEYHRRREIRAGPGKPSPAPPGGARPAPPP